MSLRQRDLPPDQNMFLPFPAVFRSGIREGKKQAGYRDYSCQALTINMNWIGAGSGVPFKQESIPEKTILRKAVLKRTVLKGGKKTIYRVPLGYLVY